MSQAKSTGPLLQRHSLNLHPCSQTKKEIHVRSKSAILLNPVNMTSFLLMISSIKVARIVVFETGEILAPTIYLYIIKFTQNTWINLSVNHSIDISKIKIKKKNE